MTVPASRFPHRNLPLLLLQARERFMARFRPLLKAHGLTEQQWRVLRALNEREFLEPREIGESCCISSPSMAVMLGRMEELGLVDRERFENDARRVRVSLTTKGRNVVAKVAPLNEARYQAIEDELGAEAIETLYAVLDQVLQALPPSPDDDE
jgi:homoprotocatechuate degradation regulator HpaR